MSAGLSRLAAGLRTTYAAVFIVAISQLVEALRLHTQALRQINTFTNIWDAGLVLFGLNLFVLAYMAYRSVYVPKLLAVLLAIAGFGYIFDSVARVLVRGSSSDISAITGMGEFVFALWLVVRGRRIALDGSGPTPTRRERPGDLEKPSDQDRGGEETTEPEARTRLAVRQVRRLLSQRGCTEVRPAGSRLTIRCGECVTTIAVHGGDVAPGPRKDRARP